MNREDIAWRAGTVANRVVQDHRLSSLPVDPMALAQALEIEVQPKSVKGVSGMLLRVGNNFGIIYSTYIPSTGFQNFSVAHELGHYFMPGHIDAVLGNGDVHQSHAGFGSGDRFEIEADHFAAALLMPESLFTGAVNAAGTGLSAIENLADRCATSLTATAIRYAQHTDEVVAVVLSTGKRVNYCFMSKVLQEIAGNNRIAKGDLLPPGTPTSEFNQDSERVSRAERSSGTSDLQDWIGGSHSVELTEEVVGLGGYGKTLTVLSATGVVDMDALEEEEELIESWTPRFRR
jgi:hypothetical protein